MKLWGRAGVFLIIVLSPLAICSLGGRVYGFRKLNAAASRWEQTYPSFRDYGPRTSSRQINGSARELARLAAQLGIAMTLPDSPDEVPVAAERRASYEAVKREVGDRLRRELGDPSGTVSPSDEKVSAFLSSHDASLDAVIRHLVAADVPHFAFHFGDGFDSTLPNLLGQIELCKVLVAAALEHERLGRREEANWALLAALRLPLGLREARTHLCQLIVLAQERDIFGALRKLSVRDPSWIELMDRLASGPPLEESVVGDAWAWDNFARNGGCFEPGSERLCALLSSPIGKPYTLLSIASYEQPMLDQLQQASAQDPCTLAPFPKPAFTKGNMAGIIYYDVTTSMWRLHWQRMSVQLTRRVLVLRQLRGTPDGPWPADMPDLGAGPCEGSAWRYERTPKGAAKLWLEPEPVWPPGSAKLERDMLPTSFEGAPAGPAKGDQARAGSTP